MSKVIKPEQGIVYECYKSMVDEFGDRARRGQKFTYDGDDTQSISNGYYCLEKASGRGISIAVPIETFASHFYPASEQTEQPKAKVKFKVGDKVMLSEDSSWHSWSDFSNPANTEGEITEIQNGDLGIIVKWDNDETNSYNDYDLVLVKAEQKSYIDGIKLKNMNLTAIAVSSVEQIKELAKVSFLKDQIEAAFPELFVTHKVGNRYKHSDGNRYILTGENGYIALTNLKTGMIESYTISVKDYNKVTSDEFNNLCKDYKELTLIKERQ